MSNIIDGNNTGLRNADMTGAKKTTGKPAGNNSPGVQTTSGGSVAEDRVDISSSPDLLKSAQEALSQTPEVNMEKVEAIKEKIAAGEYPIDADRIASKMMDLERLLS